MSSPPIAFANDDLMDLDCPELRAGTISTMDDSDHRSINGSPGTETGVTQEHKLLQTHYGIAGTYVVTAEEHSLWSEYIKSLQSEGIIETGAWVPQDESLPRPRSSLSINEDSSALNSSEDSRTSLDDTVVVDVHQSPIVPAKPLGATSPTLKSEQPEAPSSEPGLISDCETSPTSAFGTIKPLERLARAVFKFWPAGVAIYSGHTTDLQPSSNTGGGTPSKDQLQIPAACAQAATSRNEGSQYEKGGKFNHSTKLSRGTKSKSGPIPKHRCPVEAGLNCESCSGIAYFPDMARHLKSHHLNIYENTQYNGRTLSQHYEFITMQLKRSTDESCFDLLPNKIRRPYNPPTASALVMPPPPPGQLPEQVTKESSSLNEQPAQTSRPGSPCSERTATVMGPERLDRSDVRVRMGVAVPNFAADMETNPIFAMRVRRIGDELNMHRRDHQLQSTDIQFQLDSKRKELETDGGPGPSGSDQPAKRARWSRSRTEALAKLRVIDDELQRRYDEAEHKMQDLYDSRSGEQSSTLPTKGKSLERFSANPGSQSVIVTADRYDDLNTSGTVSPPDIDPDFNIFFQDYDGNTTETCF